MREAIKVAALGLLCLFLAGLVVVDMLAGLGFRWGCL